MDLEILHTTIGSFTVILLNIHPGFKIFGYPQQHLQKQLWKQVNL